MNPYSGLVDMSEAKGLLKKDGNRLSFTTSDGEIIKYYRKEWERNEEGCLDKVMTDFSNINPQDEITVEETVVND